MSQCGYANRETVLMFPIVRPAEIARTRALLKAHEALPSGLGRERLGVMATTVPPGPRNFLGLKNVRDFSDHTLEFIESLHDRYGDIVSFRMGPFRAFFFYHPDQIREIVVTHWKKLPKMKRQVKVLRQWDGNGLLLSEGEFWQRQHRLIQPAFAPKRFARYAEVMVRCTKERLAAWETLSEFAIDAEMNTLTMEIISETLFGSDVRSKSKTLEEAVQTLSAISVDEMKRLLIPPRWLPTTHNRKKLWAMGVLDDTIRGFIHARRAAGTDQGDLLSMLLLATDEEAEHNRMTDEQARDEAMVLFLAGHDTTAAALIWTCYLLGLHQEVQSKVIAEIDAVLAGREATYEDVPKLRYLKQVIQESLRLYPPAIGTFARENPEALTIGGVHVPRGSFLYTFSYVTHRDSRWFPEPERFDPDRFSPEREKIVRPTVLLSLRPERPIRFQVTKRSRAQ
jgi:cytochrome P450